MTSKRGDAREVMLHPTFLSYLATHIPVVAQSASAGIGPKEYPSDSSYLPSRPASVSSFVDIKLLCPMSTSSEQQHLPAVRLPLSSSIMFGGLIYGLHEAIQDARLKNLGDLLQVKEEMIAQLYDFVPLTFSIGGILFGLLSNYVNRQLLIPCLYVVFGLSNLLTSSINKYHVFSIVTIGITNAKLR